MSNEPYSNGSEVAVADPELAVRGRDRVPRRHELLREVDADDALHERRERERQRAGPAAAVERPLGSVERREQLLHAARSAAARSSCDRHAVSDHVTHRRTRAPISVARETIPQAIS